MSEMASTFFIPSIKTSLSWINIAGGQTDHVFSIFTLSFHICDHYCHYFCVFSFSSYRNWSTLSCRLNYQLVKADGCSPWAQFCWKFFSDSRVVSILCHLHCFLRLDDSEVKIWCRLLVFFDRHLFTDWHLVMNWDCNWNELVVFRFGLVLNWTGLVMWTCYFVVQCPEMILGSVDTR